MKFTSTGQPLAVYRLPFDIQRSVTYNLTIPFVKQAGVGVELSESIRLSQYCDLRWGSGVGIAQSRDVDKYYPFDET